ncbi:lipoprotein-releasing ABC transporter permease subunit [Alloalcanivorax profundimaris]|uniref:lipoprotein-releasing ABC transporter permease subunit n=1 Tax=Alloalcanivorax profundimaris TaxID=2735259 RepID=UPI001888C829|nr:lipoprotein-releasing ABC transporter permease subunit [Alloalcanivorax profundimaris]MBF1800488.1 lipoprotein-releasing ABC transporter permease subunit [Alloalcanivorax profundimaris]MCQ6263518.1 lipoprotein-releasing ABC transporter permease subunit [Alcanivorax sp. MM125-6]
MFRPFALFVGLRYTGARARNSFISVITLISALGLMLGVAVLITVLSVMNGFDRELQTRILGMVTHLSVHGREPVEDWRQLADQVSGYPGVAAAAPFIQLEGMLTHKGNVAGALVNGVEPEAERRVSIVGDMMWEGEFDALQDGGFGVVLGYGLARKLDAEVGDKVTLVLPEASVSPAGVMPRFKRFEVVGVFRARAEVDGLYAYVSSRDAAVLHRQPGTVEGIHLRLDDLFAAPEIGWRLQQALGPDYYTTDWTRTHGNLFQAIKMEKSMMTLLLSFIVAVAAFNIISSQVMLVTEKRGNIAVLRTLGASPGTIMRIFMVQGAVIGLAGTILGTLLGVLLANNVSEVATWIERTFNTRLFDAYFVNYLPSQLEWSDVGIIVAIAMVITFAATLYPSWRASRVRPAEALRYE